MPPNYPNQFDIAVHILCMSVCVCHCVCVATGRYHQNSKPLCQPHTSGMDCFLKIQIFSPRVPVSGSTNMWRAVVLQENGNCWSPWQNTDPHTTCTFHNNTTKYSSSSGFLWNMCHVELCELEISGLNMYYGCPLSFSLCVCMYVNMYVYIFICIYVLFIISYVYLCMCTCVYVYIHVCMYTFIYVCINGMYVWMYLYMYTCMYL